MPCASTPLDSYLAHRSARFTGAARFATEEDHRGPPAATASPPRNQFFFQDGPYHGHDAWWTAPLHALFVLLLVALLVIGVIWLVRRLSPVTAAATAPAVAPALVGGAAATDPAVATLRMRYAKGEVSREDYQNAIQDLTGEAPSASWPGDGVTEDAPTES